MSNTFGDSEATRVISALETRLNRKMKDGAVTSSTWGTVQAVDASNSEASVFLYGETNAANASGGFRIPGTTFLTVGDIVKVNINYATGERWIEEANVASAFKKVIANLTAGTVLFGSGTAAADVTLGRISAATLGLTGNLDVTGILYVKSAADSGDAVFIGNDSKLVDVDISDSLGIQGQQNPANAELYFGSARDVTIRRGGQDILATDDVFRSIRALSTERVFDGFVAGDTAARYAVLSTGEIQWGDGASATDIAIRRSAAGVLKIGQSGGSGPGRLYIGDSDSGADLSTTELYFGIERPWRFFQTGSGASAELSLAPVSADTTFGIRSLSGAQRFAFTAKDGATIASPLTLPIYTVIRSGGVTAFPASGLSDGDRVYRSDLDMEFFYNGTRWLSTKLYSMELQMFNQGVSQIITATTTAYHRGISPDLQGGSDIWIEDAIMSFFISGGTALSASHKWVVEVLSVLDNTNGTTDPVATLTIQSGTLTVVRRMSATVDALLNNGTIHDWLQTNATKTGTPGSFQYFVEVTYRIVAT